MAIQRAQRGKGEPVWSLKTSMSNMRMDRSPSRNYSIGTYRDFKRDCATVSWGTHPPTPLATSGSSPTAGGPALGSTKPGDGCWGKGAAVREPTHGWSSLLAGMRCLLRMVNLTSMAKMVSYRTLQGGAGGNWRTIEEVIDANVVRQSGSMNCGAACGEMLLRSQGVFVYQEVIADIAGAPSS